MIELLRPCDWEMQQIGNGHLPLEKKTFALNLRSCYTWQGMRTSRNNKFWIRYFVDSFIRKSCSEHRAIMFTKWKWIGSALITGSGTQETKSIRIRVLEPNGTHGVTVNWVFFHLWLVIFIFLHVVSRVPLRPMLRYARTNTRMHACIPIRVWPIFCDFRSLSLSSFRSFPTFCAAGYFFLLLVQLADENNKESTNKKNASCTLHNAHATLKRHWELRIESM